MADSAGTSKIAKKQKGRRALSTLERQKRRRTLYNKRAKSRVYIGKAYQQWKDLKSTANLKTDVEVADLLLKE